MVFVIYVYFIRDVITTIPQAPEPDSQYPDVSSFMWSPPYNFSPLKGFKKPLRENTMASEWLKMSQIPMT